MKETPATIFVDVGTQIDFDFPTFVLLAPIRTVAEDGHLQRPEVESNWHTLVSVNALQMDELTTTDGSVLEIRLHWQPGAVPEEPSSAAGTVGQYASTPGVGLVAAAGVISLLL